MQRLNTTYNPQVRDLVVQPIALADAKPVVLRHHYMQTWPQGARLALGVWHPPTAHSMLLGVLVFGYSTATEAKVARLVAGLKRDEYLEMQRMWISDRLGHNVESRVLSLAMIRLRTESHVRLVVTHAGGCKNDCGIVYQASAWLYFGRDRCTDFYLTASGAYKNLVAGMRFGRVDAKGRTRQQVGEALFGPGRIVEAWRYHYAYPVDRGLRRRLAPRAQAYPKDSERYRFNQSWQDGAGEGRGVGGSSAAAVRGSNPCGSTNTAQEAA